MIFFFERGGKYLRCDIHAAANQEGFELSLVHPDGSETVEKFADADGVYQRWQELQSTLKADGWWGPHGRDI
ncbi:MAG TPA: hypothetical protein VFX12_00460 [Vicinamibacterales bacterium]|nr:hypothetical protein [Vicinamibacterales bacterium]